MTQNSAVIFWFTLSLQLTKKAPKSFSQVNAALVFCKNQPDDWSFWKESHEKDGGFILVAILNNNVVGFVAAEVSDMPSLPFLNPMKRCRIATIVVSDEHQKKGIGSALFEKVCKIAKERGAHRLSLEVFSFNKEAVNFYEKHGFRSTAKYIEIISLNKVIAKKKSVHYL